MITGLAEVQVDVDEHLQTWEPEGAVVGKDDVILMRSHGRCPRLVTPAQLTVVDRVCDDVAHSRDPLTRIHVWKEDSDGERTYEDRANKHQQRADAIVTNTASQPRHVNIQMSR